MPQADGKSAFDVFCVALDLEAEERAAYLEQACAADPPLRAEVESLLRVHNRGAPAFLRNPLQLGSSGEMFAQFLEGATTGARFGPYEIVRRLAAGGMGAVYLAERTDEAFQKQVAIKLIHPALWGLDAVQRFRQERQVLADLDHPGIARLIDGGSTAGDQPYLVMEYVDGIPIHQWCKERGLDVAARLDLFLQVCDAVSFAHQNLVIHRDLKPGNILVDRSGRVKLLDFGIAKVLGDSGPDRDDLTNTRAPHTPRYASPEQVNARRMTTATDIYSLGVVLYELLTGDFPYDLNGKSPTEIVRIITNEEPARPSRRVDGVISHRLAGDLDMIILKALAKDPSRRYGTADELASDIRRHLAGLPVLARPDTAMYRLSKFVARNKALVAGTALVVAIVFAALAVTLRAYRQATTAQHEAEWQAYVASLSAAESSLRDAQVAEAAASLEAAPPSLRSWEWHHLRARLDRSVQSFQAHWKGITRTIFLPGMSHLLTCSVDGTLKCWEGTSGKLVRQLGSYGCEVESLALVAGTELVGIGLNDGRVLLVDVASASSRELLPAGPSWAFVSVSPDGSRLACGFFDGRVRVWNVVSGALLADWKAHLGLALPAYSPDGSLLAVGGGNGGITLYDAHSHERVCDLLGHQRRVYSMAFSPDGARLVTGSMDQTANVWNVRNRVLERTFREHRATIGAISFGPDGNSVATAAGDNRLLLWSLSSGVVLGDFRGHVTDVSALAAAPDGSRLVSADWSGTVKSWEWSTEDVRTLRLVSGWIVPEVYEVAWDPPQERLVSANNSGALPVWNFSGEHMHSFVTPEPTLCVAYSPDGSSLVSANDNGEIVLFHPTDKTAFLRKKVHRGPVLSMTIHPNGQMLATASADSTVHLFRLPDVEPIGPLVGHQGAVNDVEFSPSGDRLVSAGEDGTIRLWDPVSASSTGILQVGDVVQDVAFDASGERLVSVSAAGAIQIWEVDGLRLVLSAPVPRVKLQAVGWSASGDRIAVGGSDAVVRLYDAFTGRQIMSLHGHVAPITSLRFGPKDAFLMSTSRDGTVRIWDGGNV